MGDLALACAICNETNRVIGADWTGAIRVWNAGDGVKIGDLTPNPPTLDERLAAANAAVQATTAETKAATDSYTAANAAAEKAKTQGVNDLLIYLTMGSTSLTSGAILYGFGWNTLNFTALPLLAITAIAILWLATIRRGGRPAIASGAA